MANWKLPGLQRDIDLYVEPPEADFELPADVGQTSPTEDDVRAVSEALISAEVEAQALPDLIRELQDAAQIVSTEYERSTATQDDRSIYADAITRLRYLLDEWTSYQQRLADYISRLRQVIAVMEHDIQWQRYVAAQYGQTEFDREVRAMPAVAAALVPA